jgi:outer membrane protein TolC
MPNYFTIVAQEQQLRALQEQMQLSKDRLNLAQLKFDVGTGVKPDVLQAQIDYNNQQASYMATEAEAEKLKTQLNVLLGLSPRAVYRVADTAIENETGFLPDTTLHNLLASNPALQLSAQRVTVTGLQLREARTELLPRLSFNSAYNFNRTSNKTVINPYSPLFNQNAGFNYGFTASVPIFNGFSVRRNIKAAELDVAYQELNFERTKDTVQNALLTAWRDYDLYKRTVHLQEENLKLVRENLMIARERYRIGISTYLEMREAEQNLATASASLINARYDAKLAEIELLRLTGRLVL